MEKWDVEHFLKLCHGAGGHFVEEDPLTQRRVLEDEQYGSAAQLEAGGV